jgi:DNA-binding transcriptional ArsR family regulator
MNAHWQDPREMTDEEAMRWMQDLIARITDEKGAAGNACNFEAIKLPIRRKILHSLKERALEIDELSERLGLGGMALKYHLNFLESAYFIYREGNKVDLTPGGVSVVRSDRQQGKQTS